jgi:mannose-6-phosphate isomerase-like protein (cupin superfamily)
MEDKLGHLKLIDLKKLIEECREEWHNSNLCQVNDSLVRLGIIEGEFHWHKHDKEDEFFYVVSGKLLIDIGEDTIELLPQQAFTVSKGINHRTRAPEKTVILMVEKDTVNPKGD